MEGTTVKVSNQVKKVLDNIKNRNGHSSMDSVIRYVLIKAKEME